MTVPHTHARISDKPLRLWPGVAAAVLLVLVSVAIPIFVPAAGGLAILGGLAAGLIVLVWWLFFSRAPWSERLGAIGLMILAVAATRPFLHQSIRGGMMGMMFFVYVIPALSVALVAAALASRRHSGGSRRVSILVGVLLACGAFMLLRTNGISGDADSDFEWRWTPTAEERLLASGDRALDAPAGSARGGSAPTPSAPAPAPASPPAAAESGEKPGPAKDAVAPAPRTAPPAAANTPENAPIPAVAEMRAIWPGFRGADRNAVVRGMRIETDWSKSPPVAVWRRPVGPGWSSFAVRGDFVYTQEQRGDHELVSCYRLTTGEPVWRHRDAVRFWESNGGPGPRATPTVRGGRVYTFGATGIVNALDADTGAVVWSHNAATDTDVKVPDWGFASSPLVIDNLVVVAASGRLVAYDARTGNRRWLGPEGGAGYSSPHLVTIDGVRQILLLRGSRTISVAPADGRLLWEHTWEPGVGIVQPGLAPDGDVLLTVGDAMGGVGMRRVAVAQGSAGWTVEERWTSRGLKPYFNDFVVHGGHAFGFDGSILACINLADGERKWKGGRYGHGQLVLLPDQDLMLVLSEEGEIALVRATPDKFIELARIPAIEGKTWNHPVIAGDLLLVRNGEEMAAFRLPLAAR